MRSLIRRLEEASPAMGSKEWLAGVKKWWNQWVEDADRISKIRDQQDRRKVRAWFVDGEKRLNMLVDVLVRRANLVTAPALASITTGDDNREYKDGVGRLKVPRSYSVLGFKVKPEPGDLVHSHLQAALDLLGNVQDHEQDRWVDMQRRPDERDWGTTGDLDYWQAYLEIMPHNISGVDADVQAAMRKFAMQMKSEPNRESVINDAIPLDYDLGGMKVLTNPGSLSSLYSAVTGDEQDDMENAMVDAATSKEVRAGLMLAQRALEQRGFGKVWHGKIYVLPPRLAATFTKAKTRQSFLSGGHYDHSKDIVVINPRHNWKATTISEIVVHELGHRYWYRFMKAGARARFAAWFDPRTKAEQDRAGAKSEYVPAPTAYGSESPVEEFAETFAAYVLGKYDGITLTGPQKARFEALALGRAAQSEDEDGPSRTFPGSTKDA